MQIFTRLFLTWLCGVGIGVQAVSMDNPGDDFRHAAVEYENQSLDFIESAADIDEDQAGRHIQIATVLRRMAQIKYAAAELADQDRWEEIDWGEYQMLELERDRLMGELQRTHRQFGQPDLQPSHDFLIAAERYEADARDARDRAVDAHGVEKAIFEQLSMVFDELAFIKHEAAIADQSGRAFDWSYYEELSRKRDNLLDLLDHANNS